MQLQGPGRKKEGDEQSLFSKGSSAFQNVFRKGQEKQENSADVNAKQGVWKSASLLKAALNNSRVPPQSSSHGPPQSSSRVSPKSSSHGKVLWKSADAPKRGGNVASIRRLSRRELELKKLELRPLLNALRFVESSNRVNVPDGDDGTSIGPFQISLDYHQDVWQKKKSWEKARNVDHAEETVIKYWSIYCPKALETQDYETLAKIHNGGPQGPSAAKTTYYWSKVLRHLKQQQDLRIPADAQHLSPRKAGGANTKWKDAPRKGDRSGRGKHPVQPLRLSITTKSPLLKEHRHSSKASRPIHQAKLVPIKAHHVYRPRAAAKDRTGFKKVVRAAQKAPPQKRPVVHSRRSSFSSNTTYGQYTQASSSAVPGGGFSLTQVRTPGKPGAGPSKPCSSEASPKTPKPSVDDLSIRPCDSISQRQSPENSFVTNSPEELSPLLETRTLRRLRTQSAEDLAALSKRAESEAVIAELVQRADCKHGGLRLGFRVSSRTRLSPGKRRRHPFRSSAESETEQSDGSRPVRSVRLGISVEELQQALQEEALAQQKVAPVACISRGQDQGSDDDSDSSGLSECEVASPVSSAGSLSPNKAFSLAFIQTAIRKSQKKMAALMIQRAYLNYRPRREFVKLRGTAVRLQQLVRAWQLGKPVRERFLALRKSALVLQKRWRTKRERQSTMLQAVQERILFLTMHRAVVEIQRVWRGVRARRTLVGTRAEETNGSKIVADSLEAEAWLRTAAKTRRGRECGSKFETPPQLSLDTGRAGGGPGMLELPVALKTKSSLLDCEKESADSFSKAGQSLASLHSASQLSPQNRSEPLNHRPNLRILREPCISVAGGESSDEMSKRFKEKVGSAVLEGVASPLLTPRREQALYEQLANLLPSIQSVSLDPLAEATKDPSEPVCAEERESLAVSSEEVMTKTKIGASTTIEAERRGECRESVAGVLDQELEREETRSDGQLSPGRESELLLQLAELLGHSQLESAHVQAFDDQSEAQSAEAPLRAEEAVIEEFLAGQGVRGALRDAALVIFEEEQVASWHERKPLDLVHRGLLADSCQEKEDRCQAEEKEREDAGPVCAKTEGRSEGDAYEADGHLNAELPQALGSQESAWMAALEESITPAIVPEGQFGESDMLAAESSADRLLGDPSSGECTPDRYPQTESDASVCAVQKSAFHQTPVRSPALVLAEASLLDSASKVAFWNDAAADQPLSEQNLNVSIAPPGDAVWDNDDFDLSWHNGFPEDSWTNSPSHRSLCTRQSLENESSLGEIKVSDCPSPDKSLGLVRAEVEKFNSLQKSQFTQGKEAAGHLGVKPLNNTEWSQMRRGLGLLKQWLVENKSPPGTSEKPNKPRNCELRIVETGVASDRLLLRASLTKSRSDPSLKELLSAHYRQGSPSDPASALRQSRPKQTAARKLSLPLSSAANLPITPLAEARLVPAVDSSESDLRTPIEETTLRNAGLSTPPRSELPDPEPSDSPDVSPEEPKSPERGVTFDSFAAPLQRAHTAPNPREMYAHAAHGKGETECLVCRLWEEGSFVRTKTLRYRADNLSRSRSSQELTGVSPSEDNKDTSLRTSSGPSISRSSSVTFSARQRLFRGPLNLLAERKSKASSHTRSQSLPSDSPETSSGSFGFDASRPSPEFAASPRRQPPQLPNSREVPLTSDHQTLASSKPAKPPSPWPPRPHSNSRHLSADVMEDKTAKTDKIASKLKLKLWSRTNSPVELVPSTKVSELRGGPQPVDRPGEVASEASRKQQRLYNRTSQDARVLVDSSVRELNDEAKPQKIVPQSPCTFAEKLRAALADLPSEERRLMSSRWEDSASQGVEERMQGAKDLQADFEAVTPGPSRTLSRGKLGSAKTFEKTPLAPATLMPTLVRLCQLWDARHIDLQVRAQKYRSILQDIVALGDEIRMVYYVSPTLGPPSVMQQLEWTSSLKRSEAEEQQAAEHVLRQRDCIHAGLSSQLTQTERLQLYAAWGVRRWSTGRLRRIVYKLLWIDPERCDQSAGLTAQFL